MILPQDTKEPLVDSDSELDFDLDEDDFVPPYSLAPADNAPLLSHQGDIELCPPPYSAGDDVEAACKRQPTSLREQLQKRRTRILWSCLAVIALYTTLVTVFAAHHRRPHHHTHFRPDHASGTFSALGAAGRSGCASFPPGSPYPHWSDRAQRSSNSTFLLSTSDSAEIFNQFRGDAVVGDIFLTAYDVGNDEVDNHGAIYEGDQPPPGKYVRMTVEAVYDVDDADRDEGAGWDMLQASQVCLVSRRDAPHAYPGPGRSLRNGARGIDLYAVKPADIDRLPLHFRLHVQVPRHASVELVEGKEIMERKELRSSLPPLLLQGAAGSANVKELSGVALSALRIRTLAGSINVHDTAAEVLQLRTNSGHISGSFAVSKQLEAQTEAGSIDIGLSLAEGRCGLVDADVSTKAGNIDLRHGEWAQCRTLRENVGSGSGNIRIAAHPRFEGSFRLETALGKLDVEDSGAEDPEGRGRKRTIRKTEKGGWGRKSIKGSVAWDDELKAKSSELKAETSVGKIEVAF
ncbi:hypothetical protein A1Q1_04531 [Trichosporon asahii var. asahii CBS 2479]|uniref:Uncharacterized protein n=1 Tax=Trichosporon asahii var. asahii (strain ATCC 90039 / CBS 2479 / JCM 2466 / KCTC 7840 / NBRC 103889/ NCYC 2677 / UAMH 7654) TaxID=1186058 RepID=J4UKC3_TRIAS|nr:hypothetical protein A1Q1_04531 [Trichosporon asahii var. asahii CBS 2479]EJT52320.1 hypothetical protein A1Q1_04531 [Trichosporon asahii var. asahii CBS 2479]